MPLLVTQMGFRPQNSQTISDTITAQSDVLLNLLELTPGWLTLKLNLPRVGQHHPQGRVFAVLLGQSFTHPSSPFQVLTNWKNSASIRRIGTINDRMRTKLV